MAKKPAGELLHQSTIVQYLQASGDALSVISPVIATYRHQIRGSLLLTVRLEQQAPRSRWAQRLQRIGLTVKPVYLSKEIGRLRLDGESIFDNESVDISIEPHDKDETSRYAITITALHTRKGYAPTAWLSDDEERVPGHLACYVNGMAQGSYGLMATLFRASPVAPSLVPPAILLSPVTQCNLNCVHCISRHTRKKLQKLSIPFRDRLKQYCQEGYISFIATDYSGDILWADNRFGGELEYLFSLNVPFHLDTNGAYLLPEKVESLLKSKLHSVNISLDAATDATYRRVRKGAPPLVEVLENIRHLVMMKNRLGSAVSISMSFTLMASTLHEWPDFLRMAAEIGVKVVLARHLEAYTADMEEESLWHDKRRYNEAMASAMALAEELGVTLGAPSAFMIRPDRIGHRPCPEPWRSAVLLGNGDVSACCVPGMVMGNLNETSLEDIWNGPRYQTLRMTVNTEHAPAPCKSCPMYRLPENPDSYLIYSARKASGGVSSELALRAEQ